MFKVYTVITEAFYVITINIFLSRKATKSKGGYTILVTALLFINAEMGNESAVMELLRRIVGVEEVYLVYGAYDIVAKIRTESMDQFQEIVDNRLRRLKEIRSSTKMIIIPEKPKVVVLSNERLKILA